MGGGSPGSRQNFSILSHLSMLVYLVNHAAGQGRLTTGSAAAFGCIDDSKRTLVMLASEPAPIYLCENGTRRGRLDVTL